MSVTCLACFCGRNLLSLKTYTSFGESQHPPLISDHTMGLVSVGTSFLNAVAKLASTREDIPLIFHKE